MLNKFISSLPALALVASMASAPAMAAAFTGGITAQQGVGSIIENAAFRSRRSGEEQLQRLLQPHTFYIPVTRAAREATGDPNITVIDRRHGDDVFRCSFLVQQGRRVLLCE